MKNIIIENHFIKPINKIPLDWMFLFFCFMFSTFLFLTLNFEKIKYSLITELITIFIYSFYSSHFFYFLAFPLTNKAKEYKIKTSLMYWLSFKRFFKVILFFYLIPLIILTIIIVYIFNKNPFLMLYLASLAGK